MTTRKGRAILSLRSRQFLIPIRMVFEVNSMTYSINDKALGAGEPIRVKEGQRVLLHLL